MPCLFHFQQIHVEAYDPIPLFVVTLQRHRNCVPAGLQRTDFSPSILYFLLLELQSICLFKYSNSTSSIHCLGWL